MFHAYYYTMNTQCVSHILLLLYQRYINITHVMFLVWFSAQMKASGSSTLLKGPQNIIVDTGNPWDRELILESKLCAGWSPLGHCGLPTGEYIWMELT